GDVKFGYVRANDVRIQLIEKDSVSNYEFLFREADTLQRDLPNQSHDAAEVPTVNMAEAANRMLNSVLYKIPTDMELRGFLLTYRDDSIQQRIRIPNVDVDNGNLTSAVYLNDNKAAWQVSGRLNP